MDPTARHRRSLTFLSPPNHHHHHSTLAGDGDLDEDDVIFSGDFSAPTADRRPFRRTDTPGILAALSESHPRRPILYRRASILPAVPKREVERGEMEREYSQSAPLSKFVHSAPVSVPVAKVGVVGGDLADVDVEDEGDEDMLPPHEIVARGSLMMDTVTCSVLEGVGRTLKGRDLRQVRNAVWRQTGFLD